MSKPFKILCAFICVAALLSGCQVSGTEIQTQPSPTETGFGWQQIGGQTCYIQRDGTAATGWLELDGKSYYLRRNGSMVTGWLSLEGEKYYLDSDGAVITGPCEIDGIPYLFDGRGLLTAGWVEIDGRRYCSDANCHPLTGWQDLEGGRFYLDENGAMVTGWLELDGSRYYLKEDGTPAQGCLTIDGTEHFFTSAGQEILLVNPWHQVPEGYTVDLTGIGEGHQIARCGYDDYLEMMAACKAAGLDPVVVSSYRTEEYQQYLFRSKIKSYMELGYSEEDAAELAGNSVAVPGTSEHQLGLALDIIDADNYHLDESQAKMPTQKWLMENSWRYGWILRYPNEKSRITGIIYEPWHYRYVGREVAAEIHELGICLEEYIMSLTPSVG